LFGLLRREVGSDANAVAHETLLASRLLDIQRKDEVRSLAWVNPSPTLMLAISPWLAGWCHAAIR
jgi:hypothetical protein